MARQGATNERGDHDTPSDVCAHRGSVVVDGPGGVAVTLTPDAAIETGQRLKSAGQEAHAQSHDAADDD
jgi:hypothetical protein